MRILKNLKAPEDETSLFMSSFDPTLSRTAKLQKEKDEKRKEKKEEKTRMREKLRVLTKRLPSRKGNPTRRVVAVPLLFSL